MTSDIYLIFLQPPEIPVLAGSTLLQVIDKFALTNHDVSYEVTSDNISESYTLNLYTSYSNHIVTIIMVM